MFSSQFWWLVARNPSRHDTWNICFEEALHLPDILSILYLLRVRSTHPFVRAPDALNRSGAQVIWAAPIRRASSSAPPRRTPFFHLYHFCLQRCLPIERQVVVREAVATREGSKWWAVNTVLLPFLLSGGNGIILVVLKELFVFCRDCEYMHETKELMKTVRPQGIEVPVVLSRILSSTSIDAWSSLCSTLFQYTQ